jgi:hypothetical protein
MDTQVLGPETLLPIAVVVPVLGLTWRLATRVARQDAKLDAAATAGEANTERILEAEARGRSNSERIERLEQSRARGRRADDA